MGLTLSNTIWRIISVILKTKQNIRTAGPYNDYTGLQKKCIHIISEYVGPIDFDILKLVPGSESLQGFRILRKIYFHPKKSVFCEF